jgi:hypothetical protein
MKLILDDQVFLKGRALADFSFFNGERGVL